ncbi:MAG: hypothetical protein A3B89_00590 [Candidatus Buchananbacteria bacterium RIFCSPHIGHO2_02_FULL_40_13]|uniref:Uncharacterized protein n=1 Tax=Candidatus Buchananbacteria bacterium RIFCSPLOWO2_01_FULL_39_33 TaxID=1797543 RepID=A0A1G1YGC1_9BACT|nr:MAG: hypothetical protein A3B89_00590 [Candidatus Buchananbacteria bacterium RIFCSPHIGHO2_02_FULL_40_13]OGY51403.1 MAG: hypothetical protein A3A02_00575 [Candidatus Buchananbacteria bacterium RIFCSPLOWO2_01_FULL_39_33]
MANKNQARKVKRFFYKQLKNDPNFVGADIGGNQQSGYGVRVNFRQAPINWLIPETITITIPGTTAKVPVITEIVGKITKQ